MQAMQADQAFEINRFNALCYEVFFANKKGQELLDVLEKRNFYAPVAHPGKDVAWAWFNEGRNDMIRTLRQSGQNFMLANLAEANPNTKQTKESA